MAAWQHAAETGFAYGKTPITEQVAHSCSAQATAEKASVLRQKNIEPFYFPAR
jgi:hypothetical protein